MCGIAKELEELCVWEKNKGGLSLGRDLSYSCSGAGHALLIERYAQTSTKLIRDPKVAPPPLDKFNFDEAVKACQ